MLGRANRSQRSLFRLCVTAWASCKGPPARPRPIRPPASPTASRSRNCRSRTAPRRLRSGRSLGVETLACVIGNRWRHDRARLLKLHPAAARAHINVSGSARALPVLVAIRSLQREAIRSIRPWTTGRYDDAHYPSTACAWRASSACPLPLGNGVVRPLRRVRLDAIPRRRRALRPQFERSYLEAHARRFVHQFDPIVISTLPFHGLVRPGRVRRMCDVIAGLASIRSSRPCPSASTPTSCSRSQQHRWPRAGGWRRQPAFVTCPHRPGTTPSWSISSVSGR